jgi:hypothetical protein
MLCPGKACVLGGVVAGLFDPLMIPADPDGAPPLGKATFPYQSYIDPASNDRFDTEKRL